MRWPQKHDDTRAGGFSILELLVTIGIISLLFGIAIPLMNSWLPGIRLQSAARDMGAKFQLARMRAATKNCEYRVAINNSVTPYSIQLEEGNTPLNSTTFTCAEGNYVELEDDVEFAAANPVQPSSAVDNFNICRPDGTSVAATGALLVFRPNGSTSLGSELEIRLTNAQGAKYSILVSNTTGRVKVEKDGW